MTDEIGFEVDDRGVATVTIDRPHVLNALDEASHRRLTAIWEEIEASDRIRVVVVTGAGDRAFCAGADISGAGIAKTGLEYWADGRPGGFGGLALRATLDVPVIARSTATRSAVASRWCSAATSSWPPTPRSSG